MIFPLEKVFELILTYRYAIIFPIAVIEGPIISIIAGFLASSNYLNIYFTYVLLVFADLVGDTMYYAIGRFGGNYFIKRWGWLLNLDSSKILKLEHHFDKHGGKWLSFGKTQGVGSPILVAAGVVKMPYSRYMWINIIATLIKSFLLIMIGYYFGRAYVSINDYFIKISILSLLAIVIVAIVYYLSRQRNA